MGWRAELQEVREALTAACRDPIAQQNAYITGLTTRIAGSAFARDHKLEPGMSATEYRSRVPIRTVVDFQDYVYRAYEGERDVLFPGMPIFFAQTSGTTGRPKLVAFSQHMQRGARTVVFSLNAYNPEELIASGVVLLGKFDEGASPTGIPVGGSAGFHRRAMADVPPYAVIPDALAELIDVDAKNYGILRILLARRLVHLTSLNPSTIITLFEQLRRCAPDLAAELRDGGVTRGPASVRERLRDVELAPAPERAARLDAWLRAGAQHVTDVWPELRRVTTWQEGSLGLYLPKLSSQLPGVELRRLPVGASEGHGMCPPPSGIDASIPSLLCAFYEFLPADEAVTEAKIKTIAELETNAEYRIVISNDRGLYRALTEDVFRVVGWEGPVPILLFLQRHGLTSSLTGEKLTEPHASAALAAAMRCLRASPRGAQIVPEWRDAETPRYAVTVETEGSEERAALCEFLASVETTLRTQNVEYAAKRDSRRLAPPVLLVLEAGSFDRRRIAMTAARNRDDAQYKLLPLSRDLLDRVQLRITLELDLAVVNR